MLTPAPFLRALATCSSLFWTVSGASAGADCERLHAVLGAVAAGQAAETELSTLLDSAPEASCDTFVALGASPSRYCRWQFDYRAADSETIFSNLTSAFETCFGADSTRPADRSVNHPDTYHLRQFELDGWVVSVSLKDKAGLQASFVFLRFDPLD